MDNRTDHIRGWRRVTDDTGGAAGDTVRLEATAAYLGDCGRDSAQGMAVLPEVTDFGEHGLFAGVRFDVLPVWAEAEPEPGRRRDQIPKSPAKTVQRRERYELISVVF